jgi:muramoyltetrapeptide carboxypeptidase
MNSPSQAERNRPAALRSGDIIGIIAPAGFIQREPLETGCAMLRNKGYKPVFLPSIFDRELYFAGSLERRLNEFHAMFARPDVRAIICARGGYGANYLLPHLDLGLIRANPKIFCGYSDVTALLTYLGDVTGTVVFHGPMLNQDSRPNGIDEESWSAAFTSGLPYSRHFSREELQPLLRGTAQGMLCGGCLSILCASLGTPYEIQTHGTILFLEDLAEPAFRIDRMLMQLKLAGKFDGVRGLIFGEMLNCRAPEGTTLPEVVQGIVAGLGIPVAYGLKSGHVSGRNFTLPLGVAAQLDVAATVHLQFAASVRTAPVPAPAST